MFKKTYQKINKLAQHAHATYYLVLLSALESFCSPITPLFLLIPMAIAMPAKAWRLVGIATLASTAGSVVGYFIGAEFIHLILPWIEQLGYAENYAKGDVLALFLSSIFPIPFKLFTITAGALQSEFSSFFLTVIIVRWLHFALIPIGLYWFAVPMLRWAKNKYV
jgi:membrane protein YqaA with SNARE-associated domain